MARGGLAGGIYLEQVKSHLLHGFSHFGLDSLPIAAAQGIELGRFFTAPQVALQEVDLVGRQVKAVLAGVLYIEVVPFCPGRLPDYDAQELADAMRKVNDILPRGKALQISGAHALLRPGAFGAALTHCQLVKTEDHQPLLN